MMSVEADVILVGDELFVAHESSEIQGGQTLRRLYLDPLRDHFGESHGKTDDGFVLVVDIKGDALRTWRCLEQQLAEYGSLFTRVARDKGVETVTPGPVLCVVSGNRPVEEIASAPARFCGYEGRYPADYKSDAPTHLMPLVAQSVEVVESYGQDQSRTLDDEMKRMADDARKSGRRARIWGAADTHESWRRQADAGIQLINSDRPMELSSFLQGLK